MIESKKKRMLSPEQIDVALAEIATLAAEQGVEAALIGGVALALYGSDRFTSDVDFVAAEALDALPEEQPLSFGGYLSRTPSGVPVDWVIRNDAADFVALYKEALAKAAKMPDVPVRVVTPEYLAAMKLVAGRGKDDVDLDMMITEGMVDIEAAQKIIERLLGAYAAKDFASRVAVAQWQKGRER